MLPVAFRDREMLLVALANPTNVLALDDLANADRPARGAGRSSRARTRA
jgi:hypothetical protein